MSNIAFKNILIPAAFSGLLAGVLFTLLQHIQVVPLILEAEVYEQAAAAHPAASAEHEHEAWQPQDGWQRNLFTTAANIVVALGYALLLGAALTLRAAALTWRSGLLWGLAGYVVFFVAPSLGLPPEVPGTQAAGLAQRQLWWIATAACTAAGLALLVFSARRTAKLLGVVLLIAPHFIGAPQPETPGGAAPVELVQAFIVAAFIANAVFWLALGGLFGFFHRRWAQ